ncbi:nitrilase-related carbon-nitrogen hydrolase [Kocuria turfanensis]|uniref:nitrilase-related carbon-nitrogen hydrolase n=1 Tax=Kocuria turfanensis TaxID=388357 RepID=UPI00403552F1
MARIAVLQATARPDAVDENLLVVDRAAQEAVADRADLLVTPELFATGYAPSSVHTSDGASIRERLAGIARRHRLGLVASSVDAEQDRRYISASFFDPDGVERTRYRKAHLFGDEERSVFVAGEAVPEVFSFAGLRMVLGICYDVEFPEFVRSAARRGAEVLLMPTAVPATGDVDGLPAEQTYNADRISTLMVPCRALENGVYIAYANHTGPIFTGLSCVASPHGTLLAQAGRKDELVTAEVQREVVRHARSVNTYLECARPDLFS